MRFAVLFAAGLVSLASFAVPAFAADAPNPSGTWKWTFTMGDRTIDTTLTLKLEGDKLTGTISGRGGQEQAIEDARYKDGEVSFTVTRERNGQKFTSKYAGKIDGDTIKGKVESQRGDKSQSRDWEAKRDKK